MTTAFISHAAEDEPAAMKLRGQLSAQGIDCWCFEEDLRFAEHIESRVTDALDRSDCIVVILSDNTLRSEWVRWELGYARTLHERRGGVRRPVLIPVHVYDELPQPLEIQPLRMGSVEPVGAPIPFHRHRCHRLSDERMVAVLARSMHPAITRIRDPNGMHERLFNGFERLLVELFPNKMDRPDSEVIRDWLETDLHQPGTQAWPELLLVSHIGDDVTGYAYSNYSRMHRMAYATFLGISPAWRPRTTIRWLIENARSELVREAPECRGVFFQVEPFDSGTEEEMAMRLHRVNLFQSFGGLMLLDSRGHPVRVPQPSIQLPLGPETEMGHYVMVLPFRAGAERVTYREIMDMLISAQMAGFGPSGVNVPGYGRYLQDFERRWSSHMTGETRCEKLYFTAEMRAAMRRRAP
jgi:hypothetical protein